MITLGSAQTSPASLLCSPLPPGPPSLVLIFPFLNSLQEPRILLFSDVDQFSSPSVLTPNCHIQTNQGANEQRGRHCFRKAVKFVSNKRNKTIL